MSPKQPDWWQAMTAATLMQRTVMIVVAIMAGLLILWSTGTGCVVMRRIDVPMVGGRVSSTLLTRCDSHGSLRPAGPRSVTGCCGQNAPYSCPCSLRGGAATRLFRKCRARCRCTQCGRWAGIRSLAPQAKQIEARLAELAGLADSSAAIGEPETPHLEAQSASVDPAGAEAALARLAAVRILAEGTKIGGPARFALDA